MGRIVLFGATGYTGRLAAEAMVERGLRPVLAARRRERLEAMAASWAVWRPRWRTWPTRPSVRALVERGDVLVTTVGPFARWAARRRGRLAAGAHYIDSTGEPAFIREVFERYGPVAERSAAAMLTAFGYDWVPGNLAGGIALERAGGAAVRVDIGYFIKGKARDERRDDGVDRRRAGRPELRLPRRRVQTERGAKRVRGFQVGSKKRDGGLGRQLEHFALPRIAPQLREVNAYLGWFGPLARPMQVMSMGDRRCRAASSLLKALGNRFVKGSTGGPDAESARKSGSHIVAIAYDSGGRELAQAELTGVDGYTSRPDARLGRPARGRGRPQGTGALGPVDGSGWRS